ncbi:Adhesion G protein-coupled receptor L3, partial [Trichoplax sp. H2]
MKKSAYCGSHGLKKFPDNLPVDIAVLQLQYNEIARLENGQFDNFTKLEDLDLSYNKLVNFPQAVFDLPKLTRLKYVSYDIKNMVKCTNRIKSITFSKKLKNSKGSNNVLLYPFPLAIPPKFNESKNIITQLVDHNVTIYCSAYGNPPPAISIYYRSLLIISDQLQEAAVVHTVKLFDQNNSFTCFAENNVGSIRKNIYLDVVYRPVFVHPLPTSLIFKINAGQSYLIDCTANSNPSNINYTIWSWRSDKKVILARTSKYTVLNINYDDHGTYECQACNIVGCQSRNITIHVFASQPQVSFIPTPASFLQCEFPPTNGILVSKCSALENDKVNIKCFLNSTIPLNVTFQWSFNIELGTETCPDCQIVTNSKDSTSYLTINRATISYEGYYRCSAVSDMLSLSVSAMSPVLKIIPLFMPDLLLQPVTTFNTDIYINLTCQALYGSSDRNSLNIRIGTPIYFTWYQYLPDNNTRIPLKDDQNIFIENDDLNLRSAMTIKNISRLKSTRQLQTNQINIICSGRNQVDSKEAQGQIIIIDKSFPKCQSEVNSGIEWPLTASNNVAITQCVNDTIGRIYRFCDENGIWQSPNLLNCTNPAFLDLKVLAEKFTNDSRSTEEITISLAGVTNTSDTILPGDITTTNQIMSSLANHVKDSMNKQRAFMITENYFQSGSNIVNTSNLQAWSQLSSDHLRDLNKVIEEFSFNILQSIDQISINKENIEGQLKLNTKTKDSLSFGNDQVNLPITLSNKTTKIVALRYSSMGSIIKKSLNTDELWNNAKPNITSSVLMVSTNLSTDTHFDPPIELIFQIVIEINDAVNDSKKRQWNCTFWDESSSLSDYVLITRGCWSTFQNSSHIICQCNHLSSFAILMSFANVLCSFIGAILHFFALTSFMAMLLEGIMLYLLLVRVFPLNISLKWIVISCLAIPMIIVGVTLAATAGEAYLTEEYCWLRTDNYALLAFIIPTVVIILTNCFILGVIIKTLLNRPNIQSNKAEKNRTKSTLRAIIVLLPLLGISWLFGPLAIDGSTIIFAYLFTACSAVQGLFIFLFHIVLDSQSKQLDSNCSKKSLLQIRRMISTVVMNRFGIASSNSWEEAIGYYSKRIQGFLSSS